MERGRNEERRARVTYPEKLKAVGDYIRAHEEYETKRAAVNEFSGEWVKFLRTLCKMSIRQFAVKMGVSPSYLSKLERGKETLSPDFARELYDAHYGSKEQILARRNRRNP